MKQKEKEEVVVPAGALLAAQMSARLPVHYERINARHSPLIGLRLRDRGVAVPAGGSLAPWSSAHWHCRRPPSPLGAGLFHERPSGERERERVAHEGMPNREMRGGGSLKGSSHATEGEGGGGALPGTISSPRAN